MNVTPAVTGEYTPARSDATSYRRHTRSRELMVASEHSRRLVLDAIQRIRARR
jgi:hypothetical protein